ncbi:MAG: hypothetical protein ACOC1F_02880, partial [Myxococcota bacterium]
TSAVRFVHAAPQLGTVDMGMAADGELPTTMLNTFLFRGVSFGSTAAAGSPSSFGTVDANGYVSAQFGGGVANLAVVPEGGQPGDDALVVRPKTLPNGEAVSAFVIGINGSPEFPLQLWACNETSTVQKVLASCGDGTPLDLQVAFYSTYLNGPFGVEGPRRQPLLDEVSSADTDILVLTTVWSDGDKQAFIDAAKGTFPNSYFAPTDWESEPGDPRAADGTVPPAYDEPPCSDNIVLNPNVDPVGTVKDALDEALDCLRDHCTDGVGEEGTITTNEPGKCFTENCFAQLTAFVVPNGQPCWNAALGILQGHETIAFAREAASTNPKARFAFRGHNPLLVLSRSGINLGTGEAWVLPGSDWRTVVLRVPVSLQNGAAIDLYAANLTHLNEDCFSRPYTGQYGNGKDCNEAFMEEQKLQAQRVIEWVRQNSTDQRRRVVLAIDTDTGPGYGDAIAPVAPDIYASIAAKFGLAVPWNYEPACTFCASNPLVTPPGEDPDTDSTWTQFLMLQNIPTSAVQHTDRIFTEAKYDYDHPEHGAIQIPPSFLYGIRSVIRIHK